MEGNPPIVKSAMERLKEYNYTITDVDDQGNQRPPAMKFCVKLTDFLMIGSRMVCFGCGPTEEAAAKEALRLKEFAVKKETT